MENFNKLLKIPLIKNRKEPAVKNWTNENYLETEININKFDTGLITGPKNNFFVLDVDVKDNGIEELDKYIKEFGNINTFTVKTPSGGFHYFFKYHSTKESLNYLIQKLTNRAKYRRDIYNRDVGLDIRTKGGYVKWYNNIINNSKINDVPETLLLFLLEGVIEYEKDVKTTKHTENKIISINKNIKYDITENKLKNLLNLLDDKYHENFHFWLIVLTVLKSLNNTFETFEIFETFSKKSKTKYNKQENLKHWNQNKGTIDISYLIFVLNRTKNLNLPLIPKYKYENENINLKEFVLLEINKRHLEYDQNIFNDNETIVIESTTGTGKTTSTARYSKNYIENNKDIKILSIVNLIKLSEQQIKTFNDEGIILKNYQEETNIELIDNNICICLNSIHNKLKWLDEDKLKHYIVYIDEISSFIDSLLFNDNLNGSLKQTYLMLMKIIKNCHKLILSDAILTPNILNLIGKRTKPDKIFIKNNFLKYQSIEAIRQKDENLFLTKIKEHIKNENFFLFGSDSKSIITKYYNELIKTFEDKKDKFLLITADTALKISNANHQFLNKFVFFSPSITTGINFNIDTKQDVFLYIKGKTINPALSFQQATRTRTINKLYYYSSCIQKEPKYNNINEVEQLYKNMLEVNNKLMNISANINEDDNIEIVNNSFFKLFCNGIYTQDTEQTNKIKHFELILKKQGFIIKNEGDNKQLNKELKTKMTQEDKELKIENYEKFMNDVNKENPNIYDIPIYKPLIDRTLYLKIEPEELKEFEFLIHDNFKYSSFFNFIKVFTKTEILEKRINTNNNLNIKKLDEITNKVLILRTFEKNNNITPLDINFSSSQPKTNITDEEFILITKLFRITKPKPKSDDELNKFYVGILKNIFGSLDIIKSKNTRKNNSQIRVYYFNDKLIISLFKLIKKNSTNELDETLLEKINISIPKEKNYKQYLFGKS